MNRTTWMLTAIIPALTLASCGKVATRLTPDSQARAKGRWDGVRARLKSKLAEDKYAAGELDAARRNIEESIGLDPTAPGPHILLTKLLLERGETAAAAEALTQAVEKGGESAETEYLHGVVAQRYSKLEDALTWYEQASRRDPNNAHYVAAVGETLVALGRAADALALVRDRWADFEQNATLRALAGDIYMILGRCEEAAVAYRQAVMITPDDPMLGWKLGAALVQAGKYAEAREAFSSSVTQTGAVPASALIALGRCHLALKETAEAQAVLQRATETDATSVRAWSWLCRAALARSDLLTARRAATQAVEIAGTHGQTTDGSAAADDSPLAEQEMLLAYVCLRQEDFGSAVAMLERVLQREPEEPIALFLLGQAREKLGDAPGATACYREAVRANPQCAWARQLLEKGLTAADQPADTSGAIGKGRSP